MPRQVKRSPPRPSEDCYTFADSAWELFRETLEINVESNRFSSKLKAEISGALDQVDETRGPGAGVRICAPPPAWDVIFETLEMDSESKHVGTELRRELKRALATGYTFGGGGCSCHGA